MMALREPRVNCHDEVIPLLSALHVQLYTDRQTITMGVWETLTIVAYLRILRRCGLLSFAIFGFVGLMMVYPPVDWSRWYAGRALMVDRPARYGREL